MNTFASQPPTRTSCKPPLPPPWVPQNMLRKFCKLFIVCAKLFIDIFTTFHTQLEWNIQRNCSLFINLLKYLYCSLYVDGLKLPRGIGCYYRDLYVNLCSYFSSSITLCLWPFLVLPQLHPKACFVKLWLPMPLHPRPSNRMLAHARSVPGYQRLPGSRRSGETVLWVWNSKKYYL